MAGAFIASQLYLLRGFDVSSFSFKSQKSDPKTAYIFLISIVVIIGVLILINYFRKRSPGGSRRVPSSSADTGSGPRHFSGFALHRIASSVGLDRDQTKMFDYVLKTDDVTDIEKSVNSPALLDRHFKRAYQKIERTAGSDDEAQDRLALLFSTRNVLENTSGGSLASTHQLPEGITAILNVGKEKYPVKVVSAKNDALNVESPHNALGTPIKLPRGTNLNIVVFTKNNKGFSFSSHILGAATHGGTQVLQLVHSKQLKQLSQRRFRRRQAAIPCNFFFVYAESGGKRLVVDKRRLTGSIMDISAGGCSIKTTMQVSGGARLKIEFVQGNVSVAALGQVLRTNRSGVSTIIHIKFLKVPRKSMNTISAYVYEYGNE